MIELGLPMGARNRLLAFQASFSGADKTEPNSNKDYALFLEGKASFADITRAMLKAAKRVSRKNRNSNNISSKRMT